jgi:hypothetical protein
VMAHRCFECGSRCHCGGDIDDIVFDDSPFAYRCTHCDWHQDCTEGDDDDEGEWFDDDEAE